MKKSSLVVAALICIIAASPASEAGLIPITASQFAPTDPVITFETGTTMLPTIPGITFLDTNSTQYPWYGGGAEFNSFGPGFGAQTWINFLGGPPTGAPTFSNLGIDFAGPVEAIGGYVAKVPNYLNESPSQVVVQLFDSSMNSLGTATITLNSTVNSPVFFGFTATEPIAEFSITGNNAGFFGVDNFIYGATIPEPSSLAMAVTGLITILAVRRLSRKSFPRKPLPSPFFVPPDHTIPEERE